MNTKAYFNVSGLPIEIRADLPSLLKSLKNDLQFFQAKGGDSQPGQVKIILTALPLSMNGYPYPALFSPYREMAPQPSLSVDSHISLYGRRSDITVITHFRKRTIQAAVVMDPTLLPDPVYYYCFTQPISFWLKKRGHFFLHAGCVADGPEGILILGSSRAGKSVLTTSAVRSGFQFLSDEQPLLMHRNGRLEVRAFPRRIRLDRSVATIFPELKSIIKSTPSERIVFSAEQLWPGHLAPSCTPRVLVFPRFHPRASLKLSPLDGAAALGRLLQDDYFVWYRDPPLNAVSNRHLSLLKELAKHTRAFSLGYGIKDILRIPSLLRKLL